MRKLQVFCFQGVQKETSGMTWVKEKIKPRNKLNLDLEEIKQGIKRLKSKKAP